MSGGHCPIVWCSLQPGHEGLCQQGSAYAAPPPPLRVFETGATRDTEEGKLDYEGFLNPQVLERFAQFMHEHRLQRDGSVRDSDNWQNGMPLAVYMKSLLRHVFELWTHHRRRLAVSSLLSGVRLDLDGIEATKKAELDAACAILFNTMGYMFQRLRGYTE